jgi:hypothetical protein
LFDYNICKDISATTKDTGRVYHTPIGDLPSITTILGATADKLWLEKWKAKVGEEEAKRISKEATDRGTLVHEYLERFWNKENVIPDLDKESKDVQQMTRNLILETQKGVTEVWAQEIAVWSPALNFAGRLDMVGLWNGVPSIIDFKTAKRKKYIKDIKDYYIQTAAYAHAHNELFKSKLKNLVILITVENGDVQVFEGNMIHYIPELKYRLIQYKNLQK